MVTDLDEAEAAPTIATAVDAAEVRAAVTDFSVFAFITARSTPVLA